MRKATVHFLSILITAVMFCLLLLVAKTGPQLLAGIVAIWIGANAVGLSIEWVYYRRAERRARR